MRLPAFTTSQGALSGSSFTYKECHAGVADTRALALLGPEVGGWWIYPCLKIELSGTYVRLKGNGGVG
jgi:hypothetical protein